VHALGAALAVMQAMNSEQSHGLGQPWLKRDRRANHASNSLTSSTAGAKG